MNQQIAQVLFGLFREGRERREDTRWAQNYPQSMLNHGHVVVLQLVPYIKSPPFMTVTPLVFLWNV